MNCASFQPDKKNTMSPYLLYHRRLGYISQEIMKRLMKDGFLLFLPDDLESCVECTKGKLSKTKWKGSICFNHIDICGSFPINGLNYFISFIDDFCRYAYIF